tara:strand:- start:483 stop:821 length:339 start_codon:yes stop_codon:yes gene_type:complete
MSKGLIKEHIKEIEDFEESFDWKLEEIEDSRDDKDYYEQNIYLLKDDYQMIIHQLKKLKHLTEFELKKNNEPTFSYHKQYGVRKYPYKPKKWNLSYLDYSIEEYEYKLTELK